MIRGYVGPMWAGKTTRLLKHAKGEYCAIEPVFNERNSKRDMGSKVKAIRLPGALLPDANTYIFDEVHLYEAFKNTHAFVDAFHALRSIGKDIAFAGVYYDCYNSYRAFLLYDMIFPYCDQVIFCKSLKACHVCGGPESEAVYTRNTKDTKDGDCVGDHYVNICEMCKNMLVA